ncbi:MAG: hypothetical protein LBL23_00840 [Coriobacteriales bacterium]|nr:hypothetical protein [Coriobacteriales bacterium]
MSEFVVDTGGLSRCVVGKASEEREFVRGLDEVGACFGTLALEVLEARQGCYAALA